MYIRNSSDVGPHFTILAYCSDGSLILGLSGDIAGVNERLGQLESYSGGGGYWGVEEPPASSRDEFIARRAFGRVPQFIEADTASRHGLIQALYATINLKSPEIKSWDCSDIEDLSEWKPNDPSMVEFWLNVAIGIEAANGADNRSTISARQKNMF